MRAFLVGFGLWRVFAFLCAPNLFVKMFKTALITSFTLLFNFVSSLLQFTVLVCFCHFWKDKPLLMSNLLFILEYLDQILSWKEIKEAFSIKIQTENLFLLKMKIKIQAAQIRNTMQSSSTFTRISRPIPEVKKNFIDQWLEKHYGILGSVRFYPHLSLEEVFRTLILAQNFYINTNISFSWKQSI